MELLLKRVIIMLIAISVVVPSIYFTFSYYDISNLAKNPANYIPPGSVMASKVTTSTGTFYFFVDNSSLGIMTSISVFMVPQILQATENQTTYTENITLEYSAEYRGVSIFQISGVNASGLVQELIRGDSYAEGIFNSTSLLAYLDNMTFYVASPQNTISIIGGVSILKDSIDAISSHVSIASARGVAFNGSSVISLYLYPPEDGLLQHLSLNLSYNYSEIYLGFNDLNSSTLLYLSTLAVKYGLQVSVQKNSIEFNAGEGIWPVVLYLEETGRLPSLSNIIST